MANVKPKTDSDTKRRKPKNPIAARLANPINVPFHHQFKPPGSNQDFLFRFADDEGNGILFTIGETDSQTIQTQGTGLIPGITMKMDQRFAPGVR